jgi:Fe-S cluster assembly protein SufD
VLSVELSVLPHLAGVTITSLAKAKYGKSFSEYFARETRINEHHFTTLNTALFADGLFIEVTAGKSIDKPVQVIHVFTAGSEAMIQPRHLFIIEAGATAEIIETIAAPAGTASVLVNSVTEIEVKENARMQHCYLQAMPKAISYLNHTEVREERYSHYSNYTLSLPEAAFIRNNLHIAFDGEYAEGNLYGLYLASGQQLVDNHTLVDHRVPNCNSNEWYKGILLDRAAGVFNGKIKVHQDAQKTNAFQKNNNILIDTKARINTKPQLEIFADDVKCSHGCTVGRFDEAALFYLRSRGIGEASAHTMLIEAFATDITEKIGIAELKAYLQQLITGFLTGEK